MEQGNQVAAFWWDFVQVLEIIQGALSHQWPDELPPEEQSKSEEFWMAACREEMRTRQTLSAKIRELLDRRARPSMTPIEEWLLRRRLEWAFQWGADRLQKGILPPVQLHTVLQHALVDSWESDGCQGMWLHAERGGEKHPESEWIDPA